MRILLLTPLLLLALTLPASGATPAQTQRDAIAHPTGATKVVLRVMTGGGFVPVQVNLRALPQFTLYGDGTIIVPGAVTQIFPGPAISSLVRSKLSERQVQALLQRAKAAGLLAPRAIDYGDMGAVGVSDAPTTVLTVNANGRTVKRQAYALGITGAGGRLSAAQRSARQALRRFVDKLPLGLAGAHYTPHALAVYAGPYRGQAQAGAPKVVWPLKRNLATAGRRPSSGFEFRCMTITGAAATTLLSTLSRANEQSRWVAPGNRARTYQLVARPMLPDERPCVDAG